MTLGRTAFLVASSVNTSVSLGMLVTNGPTAFQPGPLEHRESVTLPRFARKRRLPIFIRHQVSMRHKNSSSAGLLFALGAAPGFSTSETAELRLWARPGAS